MPLPNSLVLDERSLSINEFCAAESISRATYFKMKTAGNGPKEMRLPNSAIVRISPEARKEWHRRLERLALSAVVAADSERRITKAKRAGKKGAASPAHHCRRVRG